MYLYAVEVSLTTNVAMCHMVSNETVQFEHMDLTNVDEYNHFFPLKWESSSKCL